MTIDATTPPDAAPLGGDGMEKAAVADGLPAVLERLAAVIRARRGADPGQSYTSSLLRDPNRAAKKFGEEAIEAVIAAVSGDKEALAAESADVLYHWLVLIEAFGVDGEDVARRLQARENRSGHAEKAARPKA